MNAGRAALAALGRNVVTFGRAGASHGVMDSSGDFVLRMMAAGAGASWWRKGISAGLNGLSLLLQVVVVLTPGRTVPRQAVLVLTVLLALGLAYVSLRNVFTSLGAFLVVTAASLYGVVIWPLILAKLDAWVR